VDAFIAWDPIRQGPDLEAGRVLAHSGYLEDHPAASWPWREVPGHRPEEARRLVRAHVKATEFIHQNREEALKIGSNTPAWMKGR